MAKKKKSKSEAANNKKYSFELIGRILILIGVLGFGFGLVGAFIKKFAMFLLGGWWPIVLIYIILIGILMIWKRKNVKYFSAKFIGFYLVLLVVLILSHYTFITNNNTISGVINATKDNYMARIATISGTGPILSTGESTISIGGGFIGALFAGVFVQLFSLIGTFIVSCVIGVVGLIMLFDINFSELGNKLKDIKEKLYDDDEEDVEDDDEEEDFKVKNDDSKVVITSVEDLKTKQGVTTQVKEEIVTPIQSDAHPYKLPQITILDEQKNNSGKVNSNDFIRSNKTILERVLKEFGFNAQVTEIHIGPAVTQYELHVSAGTKLSKIVSLNKEIALALAAKDVRIEAPIPGKSTIGIEIPNQSVAPVKIREVLEHIPSSQKDAKILVSLGKDIMGRVQTADISKMPHLLVAGSTGSGKSVCINSFICSVLMKYRPDQVKLMLIDPKKVELSNYNGVPHLICPVVTDPKKARVALQKMVSEMERRYNEFEDKKVKNITTYNELVDKANSKNPNSMQKMPYIVMIIDELADLMMVAAKDVQDSIMRITQMARAAGMHLIVATQRPSTDVITGVVKANIPSRIAFAVASQIDSRTILDHAGAEKLLGKGDMLYLPMGENAPIRIQGCFISDAEIARLIDYVSKEQIAQYDNSITEMQVDDHNPISNDKEDYEDPLYDQIVDFAISTGKISASLVQRRFRLGYNRAARVIDLLEERGIIGPQNGSKPREILVKLEGKED